MIRRASRLAAAILALSALAGDSPSAQAPVPFSGLSEAERLALESGKKVTRIAKNANSLAIPARAPGAEDLQAAIKALKPNYLVETMAAYRADGRDLGAVLSAALLDPGSWVGIPYYSTRNEKTYDLFDKCQVLSRAGQGSGFESFAALHHMKPFDDYESRYDLTATAGGVVFVGVNASPLVYKGVKAVSPGNMAWRISAWQEGGVWYFYGVGAVKAFDMFGVARSRLEPSFIGRTESFFDFMHGRFSASRP